MFRICYASVNPAVLEIAMDQVSYLVAKARRYHWYDLDGDNLNDVTEVRYEEPTTTTTTTTTNIYKGFSLE